MVKISICKCLSCCCSINFHSHSSCSAIFLYISIKYALNSYLVFYKGRERRSACREECTFKTFSPANTFSILFSFLPHFMCYFVSSHLLSSACSCTLWNGVGVPICASSTAPHLICKTKYPSGIPLLLGNAVSAPAPLVFPYLALSFHLFLWWCFHVMWCMDWNMNVNTVSMTQLTSITLQSNIPPYLRTNFPSEGKIRLNYAR